MSSFKNVSGVDLELKVDGRSILAVAATEDSPAPPFTVPDEFVSQLAHQPHYAPADDETQAAVDAYVKSFEPVEDEAPKTKAGKKSAPVPPAELSAPTEETN